jgi:3-deoxy-D-manno-octulosonate 8-phosphate phosphatase KdsC-like HAD superfamily phosphatase
LTRTGTSEKSSTKRNNRYGIAMIKIVTMSVAISTGRSPNVVTIRVSTMAIEIAPKKNAMSTLVAVRRRSALHTTKRKIKTNIACVRSEMSSSAVTGRRF